MSNTITPILGGRVMQLFEFLKIMYNNFGSKIFKDYYEIEDTKHKKSDIIKSIFLKFIIEDDDNFIVFYGKTDNFLAKVLNGKDTLPIQDAIDINSRMDLDTFKDFFIASFGIVTLPLELKLPPAIIIGVLF